MNQTVVIVGAGFSVAAKMPTTMRLLDAFHTATPTAATPAAMQHEISDQLKKFWGEVFGWSDSMEPPTFEDHFTALDLAANTGHQLGRLYTPSRLRAIRRLSLHRVFETLDRRYRPSGEIELLVSALANGNGNTIVSTNWDIVVERHLQRAEKPYHYGIPLEFVDGRDFGNQGLKVLKLHGSANWCYCDDCRRLFANLPDEGKGAYKNWLFLEKRDFYALRAQNVDDLADWNGAHQSPECPHCQVRLSARVATFSFEKALGFFQFQGVWEAALRQLRVAETWIFIGYSLPEADFELRHLLKTAQLAGGPGRRLRIEVVLDESKAPRERFERFFGSALSNVHTNGFEAWANESLAPPEAGPPGPPV